MRLRPVLGVLLAVLLWPRIGSTQNAAAENSPPLTADEIMARVAENQDRSEALRKQYVYRQSIHILSGKPGGRLLREETANYDATPVPDGTEKKLTQLVGRYWQRKNKKYETFQGEPVPEQDSVDGSLIKDFRDDFSNDKTKDGLAKDLFPLTSEEQRDYAFSLLGREEQAGRGVYHIRFRPKDRNEYTWAGEAYIDALEFQPVRVWTKLSRRLPFVVRTMLGTDVPGVGFNVVYQRQPDGVWFPAAFGTEFRIRAVFFFNRQISIAMENSDFEHTHVESRMKVVGRVE